MVSRGSDGGRGHDDIVTAHPSVSRSVIDGEVTTPSLTVLGIEA
jgi:hypothetical protein